MNENNRYFIVTVHCKTYNDSAFMTVALTTVGGTYINEKFILDSIYMDEEIEFASVTNIIELSKEDYIDYSSSEAEPRDNKGIYDPDQFNFMSFFKSHYPEDDDPEDDLPSDIGKCPICGKKQNQNYKPYCCVDHQLEDLL